MAEPVLVMGGTGGFGSAMVHELVRRGRRVRAQGRTIARLEGSLGGVERIELAPGDALQDDPVMAAAEDCGVIVHAANLPYARWMPDMEYITSTVLRAARQPGSRALSRQRLRVRPSDEQAFERGREHAPRHAQGRLSHSPGATDPKRDHGR